MPSHKLSFTHFYALCVASFLRALRAVPKNWRSGWVSRGRLAYFAFIFVFGVGIAVFTVLSQVEDISTQSVLLRISFAAALLFLLVLVYFVGRQLVRLWRDRKQRLAGAQLHLRLALLFGFITMIPSILVALFAVSLIDYSLRGWFAERISTAVNESVEVANAYFDEHTRSVRGQILTMANDINREAPRLSTHVEGLNAYISNQTVLRNLSEGVIIDGTGRILAKSQFAFSITFSPLDKRWVEQARAGDVVIITPSRSNKIQAIVKLNSFVDAYLMVGRFIDPNVLTAVDRTKLAAKDYQSLALRQFDLQISLAVMFLVVALLLLFSSLWIGLNLATSIVEPLMNIIGVAEHVRLGNLKQRVTTKDDLDEISRLGASLNRMLDEVSNSREQLVEANKQLDARREFTEAVLGGVTSCVIGLNREGAITLPNQAACDFFQQTATTLIGTKLTTLQPAFQNLFDQSDTRKDFYESQIVIQPPLDPPPLAGGDAQEHEIGGDVTLLARLTSERVEGRLVGYVVTFDDISDFLAAQRKAAWADVARRIAHEIKNPLTPITLATDRLMKHYRPQEAKEGQKFDDYLKIIARHVGDIGRMVDAFSKFARMPAPILKPVHILKLLREQTNLIPPKSDLRIIFDFPKTPASILIKGDAGLLRQTFTNITKNAIEAMTEHRIHHPEIQIIVALKSESVMITFKDKGAGFAGHDMQKFFEPYMTTRDKGTGLGLAIAQKVIAEHKGIIELANYEHDGTIGGAVVRITLPLITEDRQGTEPPETGHPKTGHPKTTPPKTKRRRADA